MHNHTIEQETLREFSGSVGGPAKKASSLMGNMSKSKSYEKLEAEDDSSNQNAEECHTDIVSKLKLSEASSPHSPDAGPQPTSEDRLLTPNLLGGMAPSILPESIPAANVLRGSSIASDGSKSSSISNYTTNAGRRSASSRRHAYNTRPSEKISASLFLTVRGAENIFIYVWTLKDLSWTQSWYFNCWVFGILALVISFLAGIRSVCMKHPAEIWHHAAQFTWLLANFVWMTGDVHDVTFPNKPEIYDEYQQASQHIMEAGLVWAAIWYFLILPFNLLPTKISSQAEAEYEEHGLTCRLGKLFPQISFFQSWRAYENLHIVLWMLKDYSWNTLNKPLWFASTIPTVLIGIDFVYTTGRAENMIIDHVHYISQLLWVGGNLAWAAGELFTDDDDPLSLWHGGHREINSARFWSSWLLLASFFPIILLYLIWIWMTLTGRIEDEGSSRSSSKELKEKLSPPRQHNPMHGTEARTSEDSGEGTGLHFDHDKHGYRAH